MLNLFYESIRFSIHITIQYWYRLTKATHQVLHVAYLQSINYPYQFQSSFQVTIFDFAFISKATQMTLSIYSIITLLYLIINFLII
jgi:hypothetical protein